MAFAKGKHTMKVKNLTIGKIREICKNSKRCGECPLREIGVLCLGLRNMTDNLLEKNVKLKKPKEKKT